MIRSKNHNGIDGFLAGQDFAEQGEDKEDRENRIPGGTENNGRLGSAPQV